jgi:hypothetical protein
MPTLTLTISKLRFPSNGNISNPITVKLEYREYYSDTFTLIDTGVNVDVDGTILDSPLPTFQVDTTLKYVIRATNELCDFQYEQSVIINPYCPVNYELSEDETYCFFEDIVEATPPTSSENSVAVSLNRYSVCGSWIYTSFNVDGTGPATQISTANAFWVNGPGNCVTLGNTTDGPLNRSGLWSASALSEQTIGFAICVDLPETKTYYIGVGADNLAMIRIDGETILNQDPDAMDAQYGTVVSEAPFRVWAIYPVEIISGSHVIELLGHNTTGSQNPATLGAEIYDNTPAEIAAATDYTGLNLIFSTKDYVGQPIQIGTDGIGYSCPEGYSLRYCDSPIVCVRILTTPVLY